MEDVLYNALKTYFTTLSNIGYIKQEDRDKVLCLAIIHDITLNDFRGNISRENYDNINKVLYCSFGKSCLIPYPNFNKIGSLYLGGVSELTYKIKEIQETKVVKTLGDTIEEIDNIVVTE